MQKRNLRSIIHTLAATCLFVGLASLFIGCGDGDDSDSEAESPVLGGLPAAEIERVQFAAAAINTYLAEHPASADTAEGIHTSWIQWEGDLPPLEITLHALEMLEQSGSVERVRVRDREIWRRMRDRSGAQPRSSK